MQLEREEEAVGHLDLQQKGIVVKQPVAAAVAGRNVALAPPVVVAAAVEQHLGSSSREWSGIRLVVVVSHSVLELEQGAR